MKKLTRALLTAALATCSCPVMAWDGIQTGQISTIDVVADGNNFGLRIYLYGQTMCGGSSALWGYMNISATNYQASAALLYSAWAMRRPVTLYMNSTYNGVYCEIGYIQSA